MKIGTTLIADEFAEAFTMVYTRLVVTAHDEYWIRSAVDSFSGYGSSVIACDAEVGMEVGLAGAETDDGRHGAAILVFGFSADALAAAVTGRAGQCLMTCPTTAVFDGLIDSEKRIPLGKHLRFFGDGFQKSKKLDRRRFWRVPVMDGEFVVEESLGVEKGIAGGNFIIQSVDQETGLRAARRAVEAIASVRGVITPFPGGIARSGSKVGSRYSGLKASTSESFCPTLRGRVETKVPSDAHCGYEVVMDGVDRQSVERAMVEGISAACGAGIIQISAGNYGGKLGKHHFQLRELMEAAG